MRLSDKEITSLVPRLHRNEAKKSDFLLFKDSKNSGHTFEPAYEMAAYTQGKRELHETPRPVPFLVIHRTAVVLRATENGTGLGTSRETLGTFLDTG